MNITRIVLRCSNLGASVIFWQGVVGLAVTNESPGFAFLEAGAVQLMLNEVTLDTVAPSLTEIVFEVEDVLASHVELSGRGVPFEVEPRVVMEQDGRQLFATHFRDPDGNLASITGWVDG